MNSAHWQVAGICGIWSMISMSGQDCSRRMAMNMRGMSGKLKAM